MHKSRTLRKIAVKVPGGANKTHYRRRKPSKAVCGKCKTELSGVPRELPAKMKNLPKTHKRPQRPYGGVLCSSCMRDQLKQQARRKSQ